MRVWLVLISICLGISQSALCQCAQTFDTVEQIGTALNRYYEFVPPTQEQPAVRIVISDIRNDSTELLERSFASQSAKVGTLQFDKKGISPLRAKQGFERMLVKWANFKRRITKKDPPKNPALDRLLELHPEAPEVTAENLAHDYRYGASEKGQVILIVGTQGLGFLFYPAVAWIRIPNHWTEYLLLGFLYAIPELTKIYVGTEILLYPSRHHEKWYRMLYPLLSRSFKNRKNKIADELPEFIKNSESADQDDSPILLIIDRLYLAPVQSVLQDLGYTASTQPALGP